MSEKNEMVGMVQAKAIAEELYAMINVCFECKAELEERTIRLTLPTGEAFSLAVSKLERA
jgi:hypothetical protein